jgi:hypothetical protein
MAHGAWRMAHGAWRMAYGSRENADTRDSPGAAARMGVGAAPAEEPPVLRGPREVCAGQGPACPNHGRASDPILLAVAPDEFALTSGDRATRWMSTVDSGWTVRARRGARS